MYRFRKRDRKQVMMMSNSEELKTWRLRITQRRELVSEKLSKRFYKIDADFFDIKDADDVTL